MKHIRWDKLFNMMPVIVAVGFVHHRLYATATVLLFIWLDERIPKLEEDNETD